MKKPQGSIEIDRCFSEVDEWTDAELMQLRRGLASMRGVALLAEGRRVRKVLSTLCDELSPHLLSSAYARLGNEDEAA